MLKFHIQNFKFFIHVSVLYLIGQLLLLTYIYHNLDDYPHTYKRAFRVSLPCIQRRHRNPPLKNPLLSKTNKRSVGKENRRVLWQLCKRKPPYKLGKTDIFHDIRSNTESSVLAYTYFPL